MQFPTGSNEILPDLIGALAEPAGQPLRRLVFQVVEPQQFTEIRDALGRMMSHLLQDRASGFAF
jgi:hypothetical protein